jgi:peptidoglycan/xylan/chitin deacetylase (PgdA/CDA1 family)
MPGNHQQRWALLLTLALGVLPACGAEQQDGSSPAAAAPAAAFTNCSGYVGITFDDGPSSSTGALLNALKSAGLTPVTFFNIGQNVASNTSQVPLEMALGSVQNHSYTHQHMTSWTQAQVQDELTRTNQAIQSAGAPKPTLFRLPYGESSTAIQAAASAVGLKAMTWDVDSQDWNNASTAAIVSAANSLTNGQVILMHEWPANTVAAIPQIASNLAAKGLCPGVIDPATGRAVAPGGSSTTYALTVTKSGTGSGTVTSSTGGINCGATCSASYTSGAAVTLTAAAASGSTFGGWSGACTGTGTCTVTMTAARSVTATFTGSQQQGGPISINSGGSATGTFVADVDFSGGNTYSSTSAIDTSLIAGTVPPQAVFQTERYGEFTYTIPGFTAGSAQSVTLYFAETYWTAAGQRTFNVSINGTAALTAFDIFAAAGGANKAVARTFNTTANANGQVVIQLAKGGGPDNPKICGVAVASGSTSTSYALTVTKAGTGSGTVTSSTGGINCGASCSATIASGTAVTLTAAAATGSTFAGWSGACAGTGSTCTVTMTAAQSATATFNTSDTGTTYALNVTTGGTGSGTVTSSTGGINCGATCSATYASGTAVTLTATAASGSTFAGWSGACTGTGTCSVTMTAAQSVTATFNTSGTGTTPCANPVTFTNQTGNFNTTGAICLRTSSTVNGWGCSNFTGRTVSVNGGTATATCGAGPFPLAKYTDGYTYFSVSAGTYAWASLYTW